MTNLLSTIRGIQPSFQLSSGRFSQNTLSFEIAQLNSTFVSFGELLSDIPILNNGQVKAIIITDTVTAISGINPSARSFAEGAINFQSVTGELYIH
jgi:hypothetical protein